jgi:hypothetical protein
MTMTMTMRDDDGGDHHHHHHPFAFLALWEEPAGVAPPEVATLARSS